VDRKGLTINASSLAQTRNPKKMIKSKVVDSM
jgi:hypothetical protein